MFVLVVEFDDMDPVVFGPYTKETDANKAIEKLPSHYDDYTSLSVRPLTKL